MKNLGREFKNKNRLPIKQKTNGWRGDVRLFTVVLLLTLAMPSRELKAEAIKPAGTYTDAKSERRSGRIGDQPSERSDADLATQAKEWARQKWHAIKAFAGFGGATGANANAKNKLAAGPEHSSSQHNQVPANELAVAKVPETSAQTVQSALTAGPKAALAKSASQPSAISLAEAKKLPKVEVEDRRSGVQVYDLHGVKAVPVLNLDREEKYSASRWALEAKNQSTLKQKIIHSFQTPEMLLTSELRRLVSQANGAPLQSPPPVKNMPDVVFQPKGKISRESFDRLAKIASHFAPEAAIKFAPFHALTADETRFLSGLLLFEQGEKCSAAVGLFHKLSKTPSFQAEADYYLALCSKKLGMKSDFIERARRILLTQDLHYGPKILKEIGTEIPQEFTSSFGLALFKVSSNAKLMAALDPKTKQNTAYLLAEFGASSERYKTALVWAKQVPATHPKYLQARFLQALAEYQSGSKKDALKIQEELIASLDTDKANQEFQALVALNLARMYFQEKDFKNSHASFLKVY